MASLLEELFHDVGRRAGEIAEELKKCSSTVPAEIEAYRAVMEQRATRARLIVERVLADPDLSDPLFAANFFRDFKDLARLVQELENLPLLVLRRFNDRDVTATKLVRKICNEVGYPYAAPICSSLSSQYYWTVPHMDLVFVPSLEPDRLLGLADVYHELGHILLYREKNRLLIPALRVVDYHFDRLRKDAQYANWLPQSLEELELYQHRWRSAWLLKSDRRGYHILRKTQPFRAGIEAGHSTHLTWWQRCGFLRCTSNTWQVYCLCVSGPMPSRCPRPRKGHLPVW